MPYTAEFMQSLIPITQFNRGQASRIFDRLRSEHQLIVLKNNQPSAVILSPEEYSRLAQIEADYLLLLEAHRRLEQSAGQPTLSSEELMAELGIDESELDDGEDVELE